VADFKSESVAGFKSEWVADFPRNTQRLLLNEQRVEAHVSKGRTQHNCANSVQNTTNVMSADRDQNDEWAWRGSKYE